MNRTHLWFAIAIAATFGLTLAFTPRDERAEMVAIAIPTCLFIGALLSPAVREFTIRHRRAMTVAGIGVVLATFAALFIPAVSSATSPTLRGAALAVLLTAGGLLAGLPFMAARLTRDLVKIQGRPMPTPGEFHAWAEVRATVAEVVGQKGPLVRVVGPWFLLFWPLSLLFVNVAYWTALLEGRRDLAVPVLLGLIAILLIETVLLCVAAIQWTRFVGFGREPPLTAFPGRALWGWAWRWFVCASIFQFIDKLEPWLKAHLPAAAPWQLDGLQALVGLAAAVLFSPFVLIFPAVALDAADKGITASMRGYYLVGRKYLAGVALILTPYALGTWGLVVAYERYQSPVALAANFATNSLLTFATLIVGSTYVTRVYLKGTPEAAELKKPGSRPSPG